MKIHGLQKMTLLDFPGRVACTVFFGGCDMRCPFCHNAELIDGTAPAVMEEEELLSFLKDQKDINDIAPGTAGFDITEMPWGDETLVDDAEFLLRVSAEAQNESVLTKLPYDADRDIVIPWVKQFAGLVEHMKNEAGNTF